MSRALLCLMIGCSALALPCRQQLGFVTPTSVRPRPRRTCSAAAISRRAATDDAPAADDEPSSQTFFDRIVNKTESSFLGGLLGGRADGSDRAAAEPTIGLWDVLRDPVAFMEDDD